MFDVQTTIVVQSATLKLDGSQLQQLAAAGPALDKVFRYYQELNGDEHEMVRQLEPVRDLLAALEKAVYGATIAAAPAKRVTMSDEARAKISAARREVLARKANPPVGTG